MKIGILTHPLVSNYGGVLQSYALSTYLRNQGHDVIVLNRQPNMKFLFRILKSILIFFSNYFKVFAFKYKTAPEIRWNH